jgi:hypothetical protein
LENKKFVSNDVFIGIFMTIFAIIFLVQALQFPDEVAYFPVLSLVLLLIFSVWTAGLGIYKTWQVRKGKANYTNAEMKKRPFIILASIGVYIYCMGTIGFFVSSAIYMPCGMMLFGQRKIKTMIISTVGVLAFLYWLFVIQLEVYMPRTLLF